METIENETAKKIYDFVNDYVDVIYEYEKEAYQGNCDIYTADEISGALYYIIEISLEMAIRKNYKWEYIKRYCENYLAWLKFDEMKQRYGRAYEIFEWFFNDLKHYYDVITA